MRVAVVFMEYPHHQLTFAKSDVEGLRQKGLEVHTISLRGRHFSETETIFDVLTVDMFIKVVVSFFERTTYTFLLKVFSSIDSKRNLFALVYIIFRSLLAFQRVSDLKVDIVHLFWGHYPSVLGILCKEKLPALPVTMFLGAYDMERTASLTSVMVRLSDSIFTHSQLGKQKVIDKHGEAKKIFVVYRGTDLEKFVSQNVLKTPGRFLYSGRLKKEKRVDLVIKWFSTFKSIYPGATLEVMGEGPEMSSLKQTVSQLGLACSVNFTGHVGSGELIAGLRQASYMLFCSEKKGEVIPNAIKEAMACGCVPIVRRHPAIDELIENGKSGFIVEEECLADETARLILNTELDPVVINAGRKVAYKFNRTVTLGQQIMLWQRVVDSRRSLGSTSVFK